MTLRIVLGTLAAALCLTGTAAQAQALQAGFSGPRQLNIDFEQAIQVWDNPGDQAGIGLQPNLPHRCHWGSDTRLACMFDSDVPLATRFRIDVSAGLRATDGGTLPKQTAFAETARPEVAASTDEWEDGVPTIEVRVDAPVTASALQSALRLFIDGESVPVPRPESAPRSWDQGSKRSRFLLTLPRIDGHDRLVRLDVLPGLRTSDGPLPGTQSGTVLRALAKESFALRSVSCATRRGSQQFVNRGGTIAAACLPQLEMRLEFSGATEAQGAVWSRSLPAGLSLLGEYEGGGTRGGGADAIARAPGTITRIVVDAPRQALVVPMDGLREARTGTALAPVRLVLATDDIAPQLRAARTQALLADPRTMQVEAINAGETTIDIDAVGAGSAHGQVTVAEHRDSKVRAIDAAIARRALSEGGWARWTPRRPEASANARYNRSGVEFSAPAFDLFTVQGRREVLVWANEWDRDAPVVGADVELLLREIATGAIRVVARGRSGDDGVARLKLPDTMALPPLDDAGAATSQWLVRATRTSGGKGRAVLPLSTWSQRLGLAPERMAWGVSERPMYHAGEEVHFRLWLRDRDGTRLRPIRDSGPVSLRLSDEGENKTILRWQATPSSTGVLSGSVTLPAHLTDSTYCVGIEGQYNQTSGTCFFVGTYRAQDLWAQFETPGGVLRDGQRMTATLKAGYYSGGAAAGVAVDDVSVIIVPMPVEEAYPAFAGYEFIDVFAEDFDSVALEPDTALEQLDGAGQAGLRSTLAIRDDDSRPPFGVIELSAQVAPEGREGTVAGDASTRYARFPAFVGLKTVGSLDADSPVSLEGVVVSATGQTQPGATIDVEVERIETRRKLDAAQPVGQCTLHVGQPAVCAFEHRLSGLYRFTARSGDAAPTTVERYLWGADGEVATDVGEPELTLMAGDGGAPSSSQEIMLKQGFEGARVLLVASSQDRIDAYQVERLDGKVRRFRWNAPTAPSSRLAAYIRDVAPTLPRDGFLEPASMEFAEATLPGHADAAPPSTAPVSVQFEPTRTEPGARARLIIRNNSDSPREVVVSVMDDALRALAQRWLDYANPLGESWLARVRREGGGIDVEHFESNRSPWTFPLPWPAGAGVEQDLPQILGRLQSTPDEYATAPAAAPAPAPEQQTTLDRIEVTGSRIKRTDTESREAKAPDPSLQPRDEAAGPGERGDGTTAKPMAARLRVSFADNAAWEPELQLAPGETRTLEIALPDNLTRWRAVVWSSDAGDDFAMAEATLETGLPVEVRLQTPVRIYPGDQARLSAHVRQLGDQPTQASAQLRVEGLPSIVDEGKTLRLAAKGQGSIATTISPTAEGTLRVLAGASTGEGGDATALPVEVASPLIQTRVMQAGWLAGEPVSLNVPLLPIGADDAHVKVRLQRGADGWIDSWTRDMRDYPHRCWEQILSRAVAAALALQRHDPQWPDAEATVREAVDNAAVFQGGPGGFRYFTGGNDWEMPDSSVALTAYSVEAMALLRSLGHPIDAAIETRARDYLKTVRIASSDPATDERSAEARNQMTRFALAAPARADLKAEDLDTLWRNWTQLPLPAQIATARALAEHHHAQSEQALQRLLAAAPRLGAARAFRNAPQNDRWMGSNLREQCGLITLLRDYPQAGADDDRNALIRGLGDLYAGGTGAVDTQSAAACLMALRDLDRGTGAPLQAHVALGNFSTDLQLDKGQREARWSAAPDNAKQLRIESDGAAKDIASFSVELNYREDARQARASAIGFAIQRRYAVLRGGQWRPLDTTTLREGDFVRITLVVDTAAERHFVALTDQLPGGLRPIDPALSGVAGQSLLEAADPGSLSFATRRLDARQPRFYAEYLPAGHHEVNYFATAGNGGDYLAAPAVAELMYGGASTARTAAARVRIAAGKE